MNGPNASETHRLIMAAVEALAQQAENGFGKSDDMSVHAVDSAMEQTMASHFDMDATREWAQDVVISLIEENMKVESLNRIADGLDPLTEREMEEMSTSPETLARVLIKFVPYFLSIGKLIGQQSQPLEGPRRPLEPQALLDVMLKSGFEGDEDPGSEEEFLRTSAYQAFQFMEPESVSLLRDFVLGPMAQTTPSHSAMKIYFTLGMAIGVEGTKEVFGVRDSDPKGH
jgi:hypothetical protein